MAFLSLFGIIFFTLLSMGFSKMLYSLSSLDSDLDLLLENFPGEYDNYMQWENDVEKNVSASDAHLHIHSIFYGPVQLPDFGEHIYYVQQYQDGNPEQIYRQRLYSFFINETLNNIELSFFEFKEPEKYIDAQKNPKKFKNLTVNDTTQVTPDCNIHIKKDNDGIFRGGTTEKCQVEDHRSGSSIIIKDNNEFAKDYVSIHEQGFDAKTGELIFGTSEPDILNRTSHTARLFNGYVAVEDNEGNTKLMTNIKIWDVGQIIPVITDDGVPTKYSMELAFCSYEGSFDVLKLAVHEEGYKHDDKVLPVAYAWTQPNATEIGINLRFIEAGFLLV